MEGLIVEGVLDLLIKGGDWLLESLPEQDRAKVIADWQAKKAALAADRAALEAEVEAAKQDRERLEGQG